MEAQTITADEMIESLTGFEEIAIEKAFGAHLFALAEQNQTMMLRSLVFVDIKRGGANDKDAKAEAMGLTLKQVQGRFADAEDMEVSVDAGEGSPLSE